MAAKVRWSGEAFGTGGVVKTGTSKTSKSLKVLNGLALIT